jgi:hypothetical protein
MFNVAVGIAWQTSIVALPIFLVIQDRTSILVSLAVLAATSLTLKFTWWDKLDELSAPADTGTQEPSEGTVPKTTINLARADT